MASVVPSNTATHSPPTQTPSLPSTDHVNPLYAPQSPDLPYPRQAHQQRAYSVTAMPSELQRTVQRHQQRLEEQQQQQRRRDQPWWQYYYQLYHYHPPPGRKPTMFGPYLLLQTLGEGEFGKVKLGIQVQTGHEVNECEKEKQEKKKV
ncbi:hypothetical protein EC973_001651 [Apophysomyces ossiformis]|uniref:Protein kinase domain-containing protein n=1 Tax=Apophysomyces ossiformis TaxID=679940 RepID=A0A8H7BU98_9FUNG|nr:hypothetical protein EC973_001651 [Apophysomyces ossiformis]